jgi:hypothetical protein
LTIAFSLVHKQRFTRRRCPIIFGYSIVKPHPRREGGEGTNTWGQLHPCAGSPPPMSCYSWAIRDASGHPGNSTSPVSRLSPTIGVVAGKYGEIGALHRHVTQHNRSFPVSAASAAMKPFRDDFTMLAASLNAAVGGRQFGPSSGPEAIPVVSGTPFSHVFLQEFVSCLVVFGAPRVPSCVRVLLHVTCVFGLQPCRNGACSLDPFVLSPGSARVCTEPSADPVINSV